MAWHWAIAVLDRLASDAAAAGTLPAPREPDAVPGADGGVEQAARAAFGSLDALVAALSRRADLVNVGTAPGERETGAKVHDVLGHMSAAIHLRDAIRVVDSRAWAPSGGADLAFTAAVVDFSATVGGHELAEPFRVLAVWSRKPDGWRIVQLHWSVGGPVPGAPPPRTGHPGELTASTADDAAALVADDVLAPDRALAFARDSFAQLGRSSARTIAVAANTRGYRLDKAGLLDDALPLLTAAADMDPSYGMPLYNAAHVDAERGDVDGSLDYLARLQRMGKAQRARLEATRTDPVFQAVVSDPRYAALVPRSESKGPSTTGGKPCEPGPGCD